MKYLKCISNTAINLTYGKIYKIQSINEISNIFTKKPCVLIEIVNDKNNIFTYFMKEEIVNNQRTFLPVMRSKYDYENRWFIDATVEIRSEILKEILRQDRKTVNRPDKLGDRVRFPRLY